MSYAVSLVCSCCNCASLDTTVPYNHGPQFRAQFGPSGIEWMNGMTGAATLPTLDAAIQNLGTAKAGEGWEPTPGNAGASLKRLADAARRYPRSIWEVRP